MVSPLPISSPLWHQELRPDAASSFTQAGVHQEVIPGDISDCKALIIGGHDTHRGILVRSLREIGIKHIVQCVQLLHGRKALESQVFDVVLCDYYFENSSMTGQDLLDDLRRSQMLPYSTLFMMVSSEATYHKVCEIAEAALDSYLLRPHTTATLQDRLLQAHHRKKTMATIFSAIEAGKLDVAAQLCIERFNYHAIYWLYAARIGAELLIRLGEYPRAHELYENIQSIKFMPWADLGIARIQIEEGNYSDAQKTLNLLIQEQPNYAEIYDLMGQLHIEQGELDSALIAYQKASQLTPFSMVRLQKYASLAYLKGDQDTAVKVLLQVTRLGIHSKMFDCRSLVLLSICHFDGHDHKSISRVYDSMNGIYQKDSGNSRLKRLIAFCSVFKLLIEKKIDESIDWAKKISQEILLEQFDFEDAINLLAALVRLRLHGVTLEEDVTWVSALSQRFCISDAATEILCLAASGQAGFLEIIKNNHEYISQAIQTKISPDADAVSARSLMVLASKTRNARVIESVSQIIRRHSDEIDKSGSIKMIINDLKIKYCPQGCKIRLGAWNAREAGRIYIRI